MTAEERRAYGREYRAKNKGKLAEQNKAWKAANPEKWRDIQRRSDARKYARQRDEIVQARRDFRDAAPLSYHLTNAQSRARKAGLPFELTETNIAVPPSCPICAVEFEFGAGRNHQASISFDRLIPSDGYTVNNTWVICLKCNRAKNGATPELMARVLCELETRGLWSLAS